MATDFLTLPRLRDDTMDRINEAFQKVQDRLRRATAAMEQSGQPCSIIGGNAVIHWISQVDPAAYRFTQDVDLLICREDLPGVTKAMESAGFRYRHVRGIDMFLDGPVNKAQDAVHLLFAGEKVRPDDLAPAPSVEESIPGEAFQVLGLAALVRMKLTSFWLKDQTHLDDMLQVGLIDKSLKERLPIRQAERFQEILDQFEPHLGNDIELPGVTEP